MAADPAICGRRTGPRNLWPEDVDGLRAEPAYVTESTTSLTNCYGTPLPRSVLQAENTKQCNPYSKSLRDLKCTGPQSFRVRRALKHEMKAVANIPRERCLSIRRLQMKSSQGSNTSHRKHTNY